MSAFNLVSLIAKLCFLKYRTFFTDVWSWYTSIFFSGEVFLTDVHIGYGYTLRGNAKLLQWFVVTHEASNARQALIYF